MKRKLATLPLVLLLCVSILTLPVAASPEESGEPPGLEILLPDSDGEPDAVESVPDAEPFAVNEELPSGDVQEGQEDTVRDEAGLAEWLNAHKKTGGRVELGDTIVITSSVMISADRRIVIETGPYGIVFGGGALHLLGDVEITGEGVDFPVIDIEDLSADVYGRSWNRIVQAIDVTATGRDGGGGIAVRVLDDDGYSVDTSNFSVENHIRSRGAGAVGLYLAAPVDAYCLNIETEGENSAAVYAETEIGLYFCKLKAKGAGAASVSGSGDILLDTCAASPAPQNAAVISRRITEIIGNKLYYPVLQGESFFLPRSPFTFLLDGGDEPAVRPFILDFGKPDEIDTGVIARTVIQGGLLPPFKGLGLEGNFPLELVVDVRDPSIPCIYMLYFGEHPDNGPFVSCFLYDGFGCGIEDLVIWRSDDGGASWRDFSASPDIQWIGNNWFDYYYRELSAPVMLQLEAPGKLESNVVTLYPLDGGADGDLGGDRNGSGRVVIGSPENSTGGNALEDGTSSGGNSVPDSGKPSDGRHLHSDGSKSGGSFSGSRDTRDNMSMEKDEDGGRNNTDTAENGSGGEEPQPNPPADHPSDGVREVTQAFEKTIAETPVPKSATAVPRELENRDTLALSGLKNADFLPNSARTLQQTEGQPAANVFPSGFWPALLVLCAAVSAGVLFWKKIRFNTAAMLLPALACVLAVLCCVLLYRFDNKYTAKGPQAGDGVLLLDENTLDKYRVLHLVNGWEYYGGQLLTPGDFAENPPAPDRHIFIGQYGGFELGDPDGNPYGSSSYRMNIFTGTDETRIYMLELPEIFSAYKLWVNGELLAENGKTGERGTYAPEITNSTVTFRAADRIELIFAVSNYRHYYSGIVYPPAFGGVKAVSGLLNSRVVFSVVLCLFSLFTGLFYLCVGIFTGNKKSAVCFSALCFMYAGSVSHTLAHFLGAGYPDFLYAFEDFCFYATILGAVCLHGLICGAPKRAYRIFLILGAAVCTFSAFAPSLVAGWSVRAMNAYSWAVTAYKAAAVAYLIAATLLAVKKEVVYSKAILSGVCVFGIFLTMDAFAPLYEPIRFGWPTEIGGFALICVLGAVMTLETAWGLRERLSLAAKNEMLYENTKYMELQLSLQAEQYQSLEGHMAEAMQSRHDMRHQLTVLRDYAARGDLDELDRYIDRYLDAIPHEMQIPFCENRAADAVVRYYCSLAHGEGIKTDISLEIPQNAGQIADSDLCVLVGNLLENALEACRRMESGERFIRIRSIVKGGYLSVSVSNSFDGGLSGKDGAYSSRKRDGGGIGIASVRAVAGKYSGMASFEAEGAVFTASAVLVLDMERIGAL